MKTIQKDQKIKRLDDETAGIKVRNEGYSFVPKQVWKENVRDIDKKEAKEEKKTKK